MISISTFAPLPKLFVSIFATVILVSFATEIGVAQVQSSSPAESKLKNRAPEPIDLLEGGTFERFRPVEKWHFVKTVSAVGGKQELAIEGEAGEILLNATVTNHAPYLFTMRWQ